MRDGARCKRGVCERGHPCVALCRRRSADVTAEVGLHERDSELCIAHLGDAGRRRDGGGVAQTIAVVAAQGAVSAQGKSTRFPEEAHGQSFSFKDAVQNNGGSIVHAMKSTLQTGALNRKSNERHGAIHKERRESLRP